jgi:hypothetical protein
VRTFTLIRKEDVSGISGNGEVADGVEFLDGQVALSWRGSFHSIEIHPNLTTLMAVHGHGGKTVIEWRDKAET